MVPTLIFPFLFICLVVAGSSGRGVSAFISDPSTMPPSDGILAGAGGFKYLIKSSDGAPFIINLDICQTINGSQSCKHSVLKGDGSATFEQKTDEDSFFKFIFKTTDLRLFMTCFTNPISDFDGYCHKPYPRLSSTEAQKQSIKTPQIFTNVSFGTNFGVPTQANAHLSYLEFPNSDFEFCLVPWLHSEAKLRRKFCISNFFKDQNTCTDWTEDTISSAHGALTKPKYSGSDWLGWSVEVELPDRDSAPWFVVIIGVKNDLKGFCKKFVDFSK